MSDKGFPQQEKIRLRSQTADQLSKFLVSDDWMAGRIIFIIISNSATGLSHLANRTGRIWHTKSLSQMIITQQQPFSVLGLLSYSSHMIVTRGIKISNSFECITKIFRIKSSCNLVDYVTNLKQIYSNLCYSIQVLFGLFVFYSRSLQL